jgi:L-threonylcarbamoyladenylate synthase
VSLSARALSASLDAAAARVLAAGLVAYPTETLYGLGADARSQAAVAGLLEWKARAEANPLTILVDGSGALEPLGLALPSAGRRLADAFWPGPLTLVLAGGRGFAKGVGRADGAVGVRCSSHPVAAALAARLASEGLVITSTSLNRSGDAPARTAAEARACTGSGPRAPLLVEVAGAPEPSGTASSVVDLSGAAPRLVREGALPREALERVLGSALEAA